MVCLTALKIDSPMRALVVALTTLVVLFVADRVVAQGHSGSGAGSKQYTVRSGDTLDRVISQQIGSTPYSTVFLREALARLNPQALPQGARGVLLAGAVMQIPDACMLRQAAFGEAGGCGGASYAEAANGRPAPLTAAERMELERRSWVRYP